MVMDYSLIVLGTQLFHNPCLTLATETPLNESCKILYPGNRRMNQIYLLENLSFSHT